MRKPAPVLNPYFITYITYNYYYYRELVLCRGIGLVNGYIYISRKIM